MSLEQVRLLTNLETPTQKLLQIILLGQPELRDKLNQPELRQLAQRITARYHLTPLDATRPKPTCAIASRSRAARALPFSRLGLRALYQRSGGIPRLINVIADRALMAGYAREQASIGERLVDRAADETLPGNTRYWMRRYGRWAAAALAVLALGTAAAFYLKPHSAQPPAPVVAVPAVAPLPAVDPGKAAIETLSASLKQSPDSELTAWSQLLARWQVGSTNVSVRDAARCQTQVFPGLDCLHGKGTIVTRSPAKLSSIWLGSMLQQRMALGVVLLQHQDQRPVETRKLVDSTLAVQAVETREHLRLATRRVAHRDIGRIDLPAREQLRPRGQLGIGALLERCAERFDRCLARVGRRDRRNRRRGDDRGGRSRAECGFR